MRARGLAALLGLWTALGGCDGCGERPEPAAAPPAVEHRVRIVAGGDRVCALSGTRLSCWRLDGTDLSVPELGEVESAATESSRTCALSRGGRLVCWGERSEERTLAGLVEAQLGEQHGCGRTPSGAVRCWGDNRHGQLGDGTTEPRAEPVAVVDLGAVESLAVGAAHACALDGAGEVRCWGGYRQLEDVPRVPVTAEEVIEQARELPPPVTRPRLVDVDAVAIAAGPSGACAVLRTGAVACWRGYVSAATRPEVLPWPEDVTEVAMGGFGRCAVRRSGAVACWGYDVGEGRIAAPTAVRGVEDAVEIAVADAGACARLRTGAIVCFGGDSELVTLGSGGESR